MCFEPEYIDRRDSTEMLALSETETRALREEVRRLREELRLAHCLINSLREDIAQSIDQNAHLGAKE